MEINKSLFQPSQRLLKANEVAHILNVSRAFVYKLMQSGGLPTVSIQGTRRVRPQDLEQFIQDNLVASIAEERFR